MLHAEMTTYIPLSATCPLKPKSRRTACLAALLRPAPRQGFNGRFNAVAMSPETPVAPAPGAGSRRALSPLVRRTYSDSDEG